MTPDALAARLDAALERAELREWLTYPGDPEGNAPLTRREARGLLDDIDRLTAERDEARLLMGDWAARAGAAEAERDDLAAAVERVRNGLADLTTDIATDAGDDAATYGAEYYAGMVTVATRIMRVVRALDGADR